MNSFKSRSPFQPPSIPGYSRSKKSLGRMVDQKVNDRQQQQPSYTTNVTLPQGQMQQKFCFQLKNPTNQDQTLYWRYNMQNVVTNQYLRYIVFTQQQYYLRNIPQDAIISTIYLCCDDINGYLSQQGINTNRLCALKLSNTQVIKDQSGLRNYDLLYKQTQDVCWKIPFSLGQLKLRIKAGDQAIQGQLQTPLMVNFTIRHIGK